MKHPIFQNTIKKYAVVVVYVASIFEKCNQKICNRGSTNEGAWQSQRPLLASGLA